MTSAKSKRMYTRRIPPTEQMTLRLTKYAVKLLDELGKKSGMRRTAVIEWALRRAAEAAKINIAAS